MERLSEGDLDKIRAFLEDTSVPGDLAGFGARVLPALAKLIAADFVCRSELQPLTGKTYSRESTPSVDDDIDPEVFDLHVWEHPIVQYWSKIGATPALRTSDLLSLRLWHSSALYEEVYKKLGTHDSLGIGLPAPSGLVAGIYLERDVRFSDRERRLLETVRPHVVQLYRSAEMYSLLEQVGSLDGVLAMVLDGAGRPIVAASGVWETISRYFPGPSPAGSFFPRPLSRWLQSELSRFNVGYEVPPPATPLVARNEDGSSLILRLLAGGKTGEQVLLLFQERRRQGPSYPPDVGLTKREKEFLLLARRGMANSEIAEVLSLSRRTVEKHFENIYDKLGVNNRSAAVARCFPD